MLDLTKIQEPTKKQYYLVDGIIYTDYKDVPRSDYNPASPKGRQMPGHPQGCYKIPVYGVI